jgi:hypothetical protein
VHSLANPIDDDGFSPLQGEKSIHRLMWNFTEPGPISLEDMIDMTSGFGQPISGHLHINENPVPSDWTALSTNVEKSGDFDIRVQDLTSIYEAADE